MKGGGKVGSLTYILWLHWQSSTFNDIFGGLIRCKLLEISGFQFVSILIIPTVHREMVLTICNCNPLSHITV